jgi:hypothetical protein
MSDKNMSARRHFPFVFEYIPHFSFLNIYKWLLLLAMRDGHFVLRSKVVRDVGRHLVELSADVGAGDSSAMGAHMVAHGW